MPILALPYHDSTVISRPLTIISNFRTFFVQFIQKFSISINEHTNSFGEEVVEFYLDYILTTKRINYSMAYYISLVMERLWKSI